MDRGDREPATELTTTDFLLATLISVAFDAAGTLWVSSADDSVVAGFRPEALATSGLRTPAIKLTSSITTPTGLAFDAAHRLWVANFGSGTIVAFDRTALDRGGNTAPAIVISGAGNPTGLAFDAGGNLWVSDEQASTVSAYPAGQIAASGSPEPSVVLRTNAGSLASPNALAFDAAGRLWVANIGTHTIVSYGPAELAQGGAIRPQVVLSGRNGSFVVPGGLAFDQNGNLWVTSAGGTVTELSPAALATSGNPDPSAQLTVPNHRIFWSAAFWPKPAGLPLH